MPLGLGDGLQRLQENHPDIVLLWVCRGCDSFADAKSPFSEPQESTLSFHRRQACQAGCRCSML